MKGNRSDTPMNSATCQAYPSPKPNEPGGWLRRTLSKTVARPLRSAVMVMLPKIRKGKSAPAGRVQTRIMSASGLPGSGEEEWLDLHRRVPRQVLGKTAPVQGDRQGAHDDPGFECSARDEETPRLKAAGVIRICLGSAGSGVVGEPRHSPAPGRTPPRKARHDPQDSPGRPWNANSPAGQAKTAGCKEGHSASP